MNTMEQRYKLEAGAMLPLVVLLGTLRITGVISTTTLNLGKLDGIFTEPCVIFQLQLQLSITF